MPTVDLVNFVVDGADIVILTVRDPLAATIRDSVVAFEADHFSPHNKVGWTVTAIGVARPGRFP
jgi:hypothetical protein